MTSTPLTRRCPVCTSPLERAWFANRAAWTTWCPTCRTTEGPLAGAEQPSWLPLVDPGGAA